VAAILAGPAWSERTPLAADTGNQPLGVEAATLANAARLIPAVAGAAVHPRYMLLHALLAASGPATGPDELPAAHLRIRRAEVVLGAVTRRHAHTDPTRHHGPVRIPAPHGDRLIGALTSGLDVTATAGRYAARAAGFLDTYRGSEQAIGLLHPVSGTFQPGPITVAPGDLPALDRVLQASLNARLSPTELDDLIPDGCVCAVRQPTESAAVRTIMLGAGDLDAPRPVRDRARTTAASGRLMLLALDGHDPSTHTFDTLMAQTCVHGDLSDLPANLRPAALRWRGALLRNATVTAWRMLWRWLTDQLPDTEDGLADRLAEELCHRAGTTGQTRAALASALPQTHDGTRLHHPEADLLHPADHDAGPWELLQVLALAVRRLDELAGTDAMPCFQMAGELGPQFLRDWFAAHDGANLAPFGQTLTRMLLAHARAISRQRHSWPEGRLRIPTRLFTIDDQLHINGREGTGSPGLRLSALAGLLRAANALTVNADGLWTPGPGAQEIGT
jgi:hypothetical protein